MVYDSVQELFLSLSPAAEEILWLLTTDFTSFVMSLVLPTLLLYISLYAHTKASMRIFEMLSFLASMCYLGSTWLFIPKCRAVRSLQLFAGTTFSLPPILYI